MREVSRERRKIKREERNERERERESERERERERERGERKTIKTGECKGVYRGSGMGKECRK